MAIVEFASDKQRLAGVIGSYLLTLFPQRAERLKTQTFTLAEGQEDFGFIDRLLRLGLLHKIAQSDDAEALATYHRKFWQGDVATEYHKKFATPNAILPQFASIPQDIDDLINASEMPFTTLCEIGSGSGVMLDYLSKNIQNIDQFVGIDLSKDTVAQCNQKFGSSHLSFVAADAREWTRENAQSHWVFMTYRGVLEYFPQDILLSFLQEVRKISSPCIFAIVEPVGLDYDMSKETESKHYSQEFSYCHNYQYLFEKAGFNVNSMQIEPWIPNHTNLLYMTATSAA